MNFYLVDKIGDGTENNSFRPNVADGVSYVCTEVGNSFLVGTNDILNETEIADLQTFCSYNDLVYADAVKWNVGGSG